MRDTVQQMIRVWWKQMIVSSFLIFCLLFLVHILGILWWNARSTSLRVQQQLGVFVYLQDDATEEGIKLIDELQQASLTTTFFSKDDAFRLLANRLPDVLQQLSAYGIENPLPPTIYIVYRNQQQYESMRSIIARYDHIINTSDRLSLTDSFNDQLSRSSKLVTMMHVLFLVCLLLIWWVLVMIATVLSYIVTTLLYRFRQQVEITSLLWWSWWVMLSPFMSIIALVIFLAWILSTWLSWYGGQRLDTYFLDLLDSSFFALYLPQGAWSWRLLTELFVLMWLWMMLVQIRAWHFFRTQHI